MGEVLDFSDLGEGQKFSYKGDVFEIPAITNSKAVQLYTMGKEFNAKRELRKKERSEQRIAKGIPLEGEDADLDDLEDVTESFIYFQAGFISSVVVNSDGNPVTREQILEWPTKLTTKVNSLINSEVSGSVDKDDEKK